MRSNDALWRASDRWSADFAYLYFDYFTLSGWIDLPRFKYACEGTASARAELPADAMIGSFELLPFEDERKRRI
ncbi:hypothetical protein [Cupriavidus sp. AcVe19-6a]|uniref:hypothetical protein n=1 Tax=Cupriavidus sp. AcVe19-6a TaxID=2821358 RepID=UPI001AEB9C02|nr:hypothetical protein [Cupriavidus sp. AcVe19-6a]MBP0639676.1 hypothetical protein [Cupriavidus sp. AcVe19-6a]